MTVGSVGSKPPSMYAALEDFSVGNPMAHLARVVAEAKERSEEAQDQAYDSAKADIAKHTAEEVSSLHAAADETWKGALVGGMLSVGGAAIGAGVIVGGPNVANGASLPKSVRLADVGGKLMGGSSGIANQGFQSRAQDDQADAARARGAAAASRTDLDRAGEQRKRAIGGQDEAMSTLREAMKQNHDARMESIRTIRG
jgi:hypothetical protein